MAELPQTLTPEGRSAINCFLFHLEQQGIAWSQLVPDGSTQRPAALERAVNIGMRKYGLNKGTRAALNRAFGLVLQAESGRARLAPTWLEHTNLMANLPQTPSAGDRSRISRFLCHLEQQGSAWSQLVPTGSTQRPIALEQAVNIGMREYGVSMNTRAALNRTFGFQLEADSRRRQ